MKQILIAFQFLTIIPLKVKGDISEKEISQSAAFFPIVGAFQGLLALLSAFLLLKVFPSEIASGLIILILIISNGGFHIDGLADTFDALAVKSSRDEAIDREKRLSVMKDSTTGSIGVVAIAITILLKFLFVNSILHNHPLLTAYCLLFLMPVFSKWVMIPAMYHGISARQDGLGKIFLNNIRVTAVIFSSFLITLFYLLVVVASQVYFYKEIPLNLPIPPLVKGGEGGFLKGDIGGLILLFIILFTLLYVFSFVSVKFCIRKFSGLTGDSLGAISEISEILFLMVTSIWLQHSI